MENGLPAGEYNREPRWFKQERGAERQGAPLE